MFAKSSLCVFLAVALSATSVLASAGAGPNESAQVGRRFESDTSDYVPGSQSEEHPHCNSRIINVRGVKKVIRNNSHECQKAAEEAAADGQPTGDFGGENGNIPDDATVLPGDEDVADEEDEDRRPLLYESDNEEESDQEDEGEVSEADVGSGDESDGGYSDDSGDEDEEAYNRPGQGIDV